MSKSTNESRLRKKRILLKQGNRCALCGQRITRKTATLDHIIPRAKRGGNGIENLQLAHQKCNVKKADRVKVDIVLI